MARDLAVGSTEPPVPVLSFVIPTHDVAPYVDRCLRSILASGAPIEVIVVDDASADDTAAIVAGIAAHDRRVRLETLERSVGPGRARNHGLATAAGEYVWFVDGDDWLLDGAVDAVLARLAGIDTGDDIDVLLVDHVRTYPSGRTAPSPIGHLLRQAPAGPFALTEWPDAIEVLHTPWNKVIRRTFLEHAGVRFSASPVYEDVSFTYRVLLAARRIAVLRAACYSYRTARPGALTRSSGEKHLAWLDEWGTVLRHHDIAPELRPVLVERMRRHGWDVLGLRNGRRVRGETRRVFLEGFVGLNRDAAPMAARPDRTLDLGWRAAAEVRVVGNWLRWAGRRAVARLRTSS